MHKYYKVYKQNIDKTKKKKIFETNKNVMFVECVNLSVRITIMTKDITIITNTYLDRIIQLFYINKVQFSKSKNKNIVFKIKTYIKLFIQISLFNAFI